MASNVAPYTIQYDTSSALKAAADVDRLVKSIEALDAACTRTKKATADVAAGAGASAAAAAPKVQQLAAALGDVAEKGEKARATLDGISGVAGDASSSLAGIGAVMATLSAGLGILRSYHQTLAEVADFAARAADDVARLRDETRELKSLGGKAGADDTTIPQLLRMDMQTGAGQAESRTFSASFEGVIPRGADKNNIAPGTREAFKVEALKAGQRLGVDAATMGRVAGSIPGYQKVGSVEEAMDQVGAAAWGAEKGASPYSSIFKALQKMAPITVKGKGGGGFRDISEAAIALGAVDAISGSADQAQHRIIQVQRLLGTTKGPAGDWLRAKGVRPEMDFDEKLAQIAPDITGPDGEQVLLKQGFGLQAQNESAVAVARELPIIQKRLAERRGRNFGADAMKANADYYQNDPQARRAVADARVRAATTMRGMENEEYRTAQQEATAQLLAEGVLNSKDTALMDSIYEANVLGVPLVGNPGVPKAAQARINARAHQNLVKGLKDTGVIDTRVGLGPNPEMIEFTRKYPGLLSGEAEDPARAFKELAPAVRQRGGEPFGDTKQVENKLDTIITLMRQGQTLGPLPPPRDWEGKASVGPKR